jgi:hypothetical protein
MDYTAALAKLKSLELEGKDELISAIEGKVSTLETKNYEIIGEKRNASTKAQSMQSALEAIAKAVGVEGDIDTILESAQGKVTGIAAKVSELEAAKTTLETTLAETTSKVQTFERKGKLQELATKSGANAAVLERLFPDLDTLAVGDDGTVMLGDKPLAEAVDADPTLKAFAPALFVGTAPAPGPAPAPKGAPKLPGGSPTPAPAADPVAAYVGKAYGGAKALGIGGKKE